MHVYIYSYSTFRYMYIASMVHELYSRTVYVEFVNYHNIDYIGACNEACLPSVSELG